MRLSLRPPAPSSTRSFAAVGSLIASLLPVAGPARAQYGQPPAATYSAPAFSGGQWFSSYRTPGTPIPYSSGGNGTGTGDSSMQVNSTGTVTAAFTWSDAGNPADPAPPCVIKQTGYAEWYGVPPFTSSPSCSDGLGDPEVGSSSGQTLQGRSSGTRYGLGVPSSGVISVSLTGAQANVRPTGVDSGMFGSSVNWNVTAYPVTISLGGTTPDSSGNLNILIGQGCTGSLSTAAPVTFSNYRWSAGGDTFDRFVVTPDQTAGEAVFITDAEWTQPIPHWHYLKDSGSGTFTVTCSATVNVGGTAIGTIQGQQNVQVWAPYYMFKNMAGPVSVGDIGDGLELYAGGPATGGGGWDPPGMLNGGRVGTPDLFRPSGVGLWQFVQLASPGRWEYATSSGTATVYPFKYDGMSGLDNHYPYPSDPGSYTPPYPANSADLPTTSPAVPTYWMDDTPGEPLDGFYSRVRVDEAFDDYMMYEPPDAGFGSEWVPLHLFKWKWQADISQTGTGWAAGWTPTPPGYVSNISSARCTTPPFWQYLLTNP